MKMKSMCLLLVVLCLFGGTVFAATSITAVESIRTDHDYPNENDHNSKKLTIKNGHKAWIKFDISSLDVSRLSLATLTVTLHEGPEVDNNCDLSVVNDDVSDVVDVTGITNYIPPEGVTNEPWHDRNLTYNNAPGNLIGDDDFLDATKTTFITNFIVVGDEGDSFDIDVLAALQADTDGIVQFVLHNSDNQINFATHDHNEEETWQVVINTFRGATDPIPGDTASVETSLAELSWTNPEPNDPGASIICDVYLGTDPNRPQMDKVTLGPGASSVAINATNFPTFVPLVNNTWYFWFVDCHDPSAGPGDDAFMPGLTWSFYTDDNLAPAVNAGPDQVVWLGMSGTPGQELIFLDGNTSDDGQPDPPAAYTVLWTQVDNGAPAVIISPDDTDDTTVTIIARGVYEFTLTADDTAEQIPDTVEIIVGDNPCDASHMNTGAPYITGDENEDCLVDLWDLATLIAPNWLNCTDTLTNCGN